MTRSGLVYTPKQTRDFEKAVRLAAKDAMTVQDFEQITSGYVDMRCIFYFEPPHSWSKKRREAAMLRKHHKCSKPDTSNLVKAVEDALNKLVYDDDARIAESHQAKQYGPQDCIYVEIHAVDEEV